MERTIKEDRNEMFNTEDLSTLVCVGCERTIKTWHMCTVCMRRLKAGGQLKQVEKKDPLKFESVE